MLFNDAQTVDLDGTRYTFVLNAAALVALEKACSTPARAMTWIEIAKLAEQRSFTHTARFVWAALQTHHPALTFEQVLPLIDRLGWAQLGDLVLALIQTTAPEPADGAELDGARPPAARAGRGTGGRSSSTPAAPA